MQTKPKDMHLKCEMDPCWRKVLYKRHTIHNCGALVSFLSVFICWCYCFSECCWTFIICLLFIVSSYLLFIVSSFALICFKYSENLLLSMAIDLTKPFSHNFHLFNNILYVTGILLKGTCVSFQISYEFDETHCNSSGIICSCLMLRV